MENNLHNMQPMISLGKGATFWGYTSPTNKTREAVSNWRIVIRHPNTNWEGVITSLDPYYQAQTPGLSGQFEVEVTASGPKLSEQRLKPVSESPAHVFCSINCAAMVGIVSLSNGTTAAYWTVSDAFCESED